MEKPNTNHRFGVGIHDHKGKFSDRERLALYGIGAHQTT